MSTENIVAVRAADNMLYRVPGRVVEEKDGFALIQFAAMNTRLVPMNLLEEASPGEKIEFLTCREGWRN
ncbi:MAG TPA: hypothetical protein VJP02_22845 [Candidatus Sulfotelmatobacter sp.]|nr:hypothetical protein [Candidatus Sulfotelmatobacter sp.]